MRLSSLGCERWRKRMYPGCTSWCPPTSRCSPWRTQWQVQLIQVLIESEAVARTSLTSHCFSAWFWGPQTARKCLLTDKAYESTVHLVWVLSQQSQGSSSCIPNSQQMRQDGDTAGGECEKLGRECTCGNHQVKLGTPWISDSEFRSVFWEEYLILIASTCGGVLNKPAFFLGNVIITFLVLLLPCTLENRHIFF